MSIKGSYFGACSTAFILIFNICILNTQTALADSVNSPNITLNVDTNRSTGNGAGNVAVTVNTITIAETTLPEYSSGTGKVVTLTARPGYQFDPSSAVTAISTTFGFNGTGVNVAASLTPSGTANETLSFNLTSGGSASVQDIIRINGIKVKILNAVGAAGPAQTTLSVTTSTAGGAFTNQGIVAANISKGAPDHLIFGIQPSNTQASAALLPAVRIVDFGGNTITNNSSLITLSLQTNPGAATLQGNLQVSPLNGIASWSSTDNLRIDNAASGYRLRASHGGANFLSGDTIDSTLFDITAGAAGSLVFSTQPVTTAAGEDLIISVTALDNIGNVASSTVSSITLELTTNPGSSQLTATTSLTKDTVNGVATWSAADDLRIPQSGVGYRITASGVGDPIDTDTFNIVAAAPSQIQFVQQPSTTQVGAVMSPAVVVKVVDDFGNQTTSTSNVTISLLTAPCGGTVSGSSAAAVNGVATFSNLTFDTACTGNELKAAISGIAYGTSDPFTISALAPTPTPEGIFISINRLQVKPATLINVLSSGAVTLPDTANNDPRKKGMKLTLNGTTGSASYSLPKAGWKGLGPKNNGSKGFQFKGAKCEKVVIKPTLIQAICKGKTGKLKLTEPGPIKVKLEVNKGTVRYCGACGGTVTGNPKKVLQRISCSAPSNC